MVKDLLPAADRQPNDRGRGTHNGTNVARQRCPRAATTHMTKQSMSNNTDLTWFAIRNDARNSNQTFET